MLSGQTASNYDAYLSYCKTNKLDSENAANYGDFVGTTDSSWQLMTQWKAQQQAITKLIGTLERFNGETFVDVGSNSVRTGANQVFTVSNGSGSTTSIFTIASTPRVYVTISTAQIDLLNNSFTALKDSVYGSLIMQTRLKPYLDSQVGYAVRTFSSVNGTHSVPYLAVG